MQDKRILVVDDDPVNFEVIETLLDRYNYQLHYASDGKSAISVLDHVRPDLILLDVMMPEINGVETCKKNSRNPPVGNHPHHYGDGIR